MKRAEVYVELERYQEAYDEYSLAMTMSTNVVLYLGRGNVSFRMENYEDAIEDFSRYLEDYEDGVVYGNRGYSYFKTEEAELGLADMDRCIEMLPEYAWAYYVRGQIEQSLDQFDKAKIDYDRASKLLDGGKLEDLEPES